MQTSTKVKPKSCSCRMCRRGKSSDSGHFTMLSDERSIRRKVKQILKALDEDYETLHNTSQVAKGNYYD